MQGVLSEVPRVLSENRSETPKPQNLSGLWSLFLLPVKSFSEGFQQPMFLFLTTELLLAN